MDWFAFIRKYVWDTNKTPYFVPVDRLSQSQANHEIFAYSFFIAVMFALLSIISLTENAPYGKSFTIALYTFSVACSAGLFGVTKHPYGAFYFGLAPLVALAFFFFRGFPPKIATVDEYALIIIALALLRYSMRIIRIARAYPNMPGAEP